MLNVFFPSVCTIYRVALLIEVTVNILESLHRWITVWTKMKMTPADSISGNAINSMGVSAPPPVEHTPVPASQPSPRVFQERVHISVNTLPEFTSVSALDFLTVSPNIGVERLLWAGLKKWLTAYQVVTPNYHRDCSSEMCPVALSITWDYSSLSILPTSHCGSGLAVGVCSIRLNFYC